MYSRLSKLGIALALLFIVLQFIPVNRRNPAVNASASIEMKEKLPPAVQAVFHNTCFNCHSNQTRWPWYSYIAPASWIIAHDVHEGRKKMNFSDWGNYPEAKREEKLEEICEQLMNGDMPDPKYVFVHRSSRLTQAQRELVCQWTEDSRQY